MINHRTVKTLTLVRSSETQVDFLADKLIFQQLAQMGQVRNCHIILRKKLNLKKSHLSTSLLDQEAHKSINYRNCTSLIFQVKRFRQKSGPVIFDLGKLILLLLIQMGKWYLILKAYTVEHWNVTQMSIDTRSNQTEITRWLWPKFSNLWTFFNLSLMWFLTFKLLSFILNKLRSTRTYLISI